MKKMMITTVLLAMLTTVDAQETAAPAKATKDPAVIEQRAAAKAEKRTETMTQELGLSADQAAKVEVINDRFANSMMELRQAKLTEDAQKERGKILRQNRDQELKAVLTEEQYNKMLALREEKKEEHKEKRGKLQMPHNE